MAGAVVATLTGCATGPGNGGAMSPAHGAGRWLLRLPYDAAGMPPPTLNGCETGPLERRQRKARRKAQGDRAHGSPKRQRRGVPPPTLTGCEARLLERRLRKARR